MAPLGEVLDPSMVLDDWINRAQNLPEEIRFIQDEIHDKDRQYNDLIKIIEDKDTRIQRHIKSHGSHEPNPREPGFRATISENYTKAEQLANEKVALMEKMKIITDKHLRHLDIQIKMLQDRNEPGFTEADDLPSLLRPPLTQQPQQSRVALTVNTTIAAPLSQRAEAGPSTGRVASATVRSAQAQHTSASAPATPAASMILGHKAREGSAGPGGGVPKRGPRVNSGLGTQPGTSSGLARHSSLGPGTPKGHQTAAGVQRAGSAGPRASTKATATTGPGRKVGTPLSVIGRKKSASAAAALGVNKSGLSRVKRASKASSCSTADSELSDASSGSGDEGHRSRTGTPGAGRSSTSQNNNASGSNGNGGGDAINSSSMVVDEKEGSHKSRPATVVGLKKEQKNDDEEMAEGDDDEAGDDKKYCVCQNVSFGDMVACDNDACPYEWFHWSCVGLKSEPTGTWFCPVCSEKKPALKGR